MKKAKKTSKPAYEFLGIDIENYEINIHSSINHEIRDKAYAYSNPKVFGFFTKLEVNGKLVYPEERMPSLYNMTIYGDERHEGEFSSRLDDYIVKDEDGCTIYRKARGIEFPVFDLPSGFGYLDKIRGTNDWTGCAWLPQYLVTQMLTLLPYIRPLYLAIHEVRMGKKRWINGISLQTVHPSIE